jgi:hypothetical protein
MVCTIVATPYTVHQMTQMHTTSCTVSRSTRQTVKKYLELLQGVANRRERVVEIELDDVFSHFGGDEMAEKIKKNTYRYKQLISDAIDRCTQPSPRPSP